MKSLSQTLDVVGGFGRSVRDVGLLGAVLTGDARLVSLAEHAAPRIGLCQTPDWPQADADTQGAWALATGGAGAAADACQDVAMPPDFGELIQLQKDVMALRDGRVP